MRDVYCVRYTPCAWDPRSLQSILDVPLVFQYFERTEIKEITVDIDGNQVITLPVVYTKPEASWPFSSEDLTTQSDLDQFNLKNIPFKLINANVNLLSGSAVPAFSKPLQVIDDTPYEQYAARHLYGWAFNGPIPRISSKSICNRTSVQESNVLDDNLNSFILKISSIIRMNELLSYDDEFFLAKVEQSITKLPDGHYEIELPLKENYQFLNNKQ